MKSIPVLFVDENSLYKNYSIFDAYDHSRDALTFYDRCPIICHPPCRLFSRLRSFSNASPSEKKLAFFALDRIRMFGGILEHPRSSTLWTSGNFNLDGSVDQYGGFLRSVNLSWFGYPAQKKTMLYFVGISPVQLPSFPLSLSAPSFSIGSSKNNRLKEISKNARSQTPDHMIKYFIQVMEIINKSAIK